ncbi:MAG: xanthine dehydrogenase family protein molybdopterin-binding subunit [Chloroflexi bacterium]|nr:xanthine dehydrogenase family protein molybdopterin-binding subunit [Chloroflexota bacterium]
MNLRDLQQDAGLIVTGAPQMGQDAAVPGGTEATLLLISKQGEIYAFSGKVEYGQGIRNGLALAIADELDTPIASVRVILGDTGLVPYDRGTTGSASTRTIGLQLRRAAATARRTLLALASERWGVPLAGLGIREGRIVQAGEPGRSLSFVEALQGRRLTVSIPEDAALKSPGEFQVMGRDAHRIDALARVTGQAKYSRDIAVPGMLHGKVLRPPSYGARLARLEKARAERVPGFVALVQEGDFVGVVAESEEGAEQAVASVYARWDEEREHPSDWDLPVQLKERAKELAVVRETGSLEAGFAQADRVISGLYFVPYVANAPMEPSAAVASWEDGGLTVWSGDRSPFGVRAQMAQAFGLGEERVRVIASEIGGSFGTKGAGGAAYEAARLAKAAGRPVRVAYSRQEEFIWGTVRPTALIEIRSGVKADGTIVAWEYTAYHANESEFRGMRGSDTPYSIPNVRVTVARTESPLRSGSYRSLGGAVNHFAREVHMDEIAAALERDPVELRLANLEHPRLRRVLTQAADKFGWGAPRRGLSVGRGVAIGYDAGSFLAECVELRVEGREVKVERVTAAFDGGLVLNPEGVRNQVEGSIVMGMGTALWETVEFGGGRPLNPSFSRYRVPRITDAPQIEVLLVGDPETPSTGAGEPGIVPIAAAISNAVYDATGVRIPELPIVPHLP